MDQKLTSILLILLIFGIVVLVIGAVIVAVVIQTKRGKQRTLELQSAATLLGWQFVHRPPLNWIPNLERFGLFSQGHSKLITNMLYGEIEGAKAALFDYKYTLGHGKNQHTHYQSVVYFEPGNSEPAVLFAAS